MTDTLLTGDRVLTADGWMEDHGVLIRDGRIEAIVPLDDSTAPTHHYPGAMIVPGFIDVQVNGGGGVLFNDDITPSAINAIGAAHAQFGTTGFLPTLISDTAEALETALTAAAEAVAQEVPGALGLHLEGPFLNEQKRGIHDAAHFRAIDDETLSQLSAWNSGPLVLTVAPEMVGAEMIKQLTHESVIVSAGHTQATYEQIQDALAHGMTGFTHLYNAMPPLLAREPGPVAAALESDAWCGIIADGHHVSASMIKLALRAKTDGRIMLVSDAVSVAASSLTSFDLGGTKINVIDGRCVDDKGTLAGSSITMLDAIRYCVHTLLVPLDDALRMATAEPAAFLGLSGELGTVAPGFRASLAVLSPHLEVIASFIDGQQVYQKS